MKHSGKRITKVYEFANNVTITVEVPDSFVIDCANSPYSHIDISNCSTETFSIKSGLATIHWYEYAVNEYDEY